MNTNIRLQLNVCLEVTDDKSRQHFSWRYQHRKYLSLIVGRSIRGFFILLLSSIYFEQSIQRHLLFDYILLYILYCA